MLSPTRAKIQKVIQILLFLGSLFYLWYKLSISDWEALNQLVTKIFASPSSLQLLLGVCLLMLLNWGIESLKWKLLIHDLEEISMIDAVQSVLAGVSLSLFTPNRAGEFAGKIFNLQVAGRANAIVRSMLGSFSQVLITFCTGLPVLIWFLSASNQIDQPPFILKSLAYLMVPLFVLLYFNIPKIAAHWTKWNFIHRLIPYQKEAISLSFKLLLISLILSAFRFIVFTFQYYLLLRISGCDSDGKLLLALIVLYFFLISLIPTFSLSELGIRGSVAISIFAAFGMTNASILASSLLLWIINLAIPALLGSFFIYRLRFFRNDGK